MERIIGWKIHISFLPIRNVNTFLVTRGYVQKISTVYSAIALSMHWEIGVEAISNTVIRG